MSTIRIDMNSDLGESFGSYVMGDDAALLQSVSSANVACGFHAGDPQVMHRTVALCKEANVAVGAHVSFPDLQGFGRRSMACSSDEIYTDCLYQIGALQAFCLARGLALQHVKPHGALYNQAAKDQSIANAIAAAARDAGRGIILVGLPGSESERAALAAGVPFAAEGFADRAYMRDGSLMPRSQPGAVIHDTSRITQRVVQMVRRGTVVAEDGTEIEFRPATLCVHGDTSGAVAITEAIRRALETVGVVISPLRDSMTQGGLP